MWNFPQRQTNLHDRVILTAVRQEDLSLLNPNLTISLLMARTPASKPVSSTKKTVTRSPRKESSEPHDADLAVLLGSAKTHWDAFHTYVHQELPGATMVWKHYATSGWRLVLRCNLRNLCYLNPLAARFIATFAFSEQAVSAAEQSGLPDKILIPMRKAPKYPEGRPVRIEVATSSDLKMAKRLLAIKAAH